LTTIAFAAGGGGHGGEGNNMGGAGGEGGSVAVNIIETYVMGGIFNGTY